MHELPTELNIGGLIYQVRLKKLIDGNEELGGQVEYGKLSIELRDNIHPESLKKFLIHEAVHALLEENGMARFNKEDFVDRLSSALYRFLQDNDMSFIRRETNAVEGPQEVPPLVSTIVNEINSIQKAESNVKQASILTGTGFTFAEAARVKMQFEEAAKDTKNTRTVNGATHYRARYVCTFCKHRGRRYVHPDESSLRCHSCNEELLIRSASLKGFPYPDNYGNYFKAVESVKKEATVDE